MLLVSLLSGLHCVTQLVVLVGLLHLAVHLHHMLVPLLQSGAQLTLTTSLCLASTILTGRLFNSISHLVSNRTDENK
jgi:hypothetical protein